MVVVAIIAILALMAVPLNTDKLVREQVVEAMKLTEIAKAPVAASWALAGTFPPTTRRPDCRRPTRWSATTCSR